MDSKSPETRRRRRTPASPISMLEGLLERDFTVSSIRPAPMWTIGAGQRASEAAAAMAARDFDIAGLAADPITHFVTRASLQAAGKTVRAAARPILASSCIANTLPLGALFDRLSVDEFVFVLDRDQVRSVVTRADLQAPAVGIVVLSYLMAMEVGLRQIVMHDNPVGWHEVMPADRKAKALELYAKKRASNVAIGLEDCLFFGDWLSLLERNEALRVRLGFESRRKFSSFCGSFDKLRNTLAHGGSLLDDGEPNAALARLRRVRDFADRVWSEVEGHDGLWDLYAASLVRQTSTRILAGPGAVEKLRWRKPVHVLTASNPDSFSRPESVNRAANTRLRALLVQRGCRPIRVTGVAQDGSWEESSFLAAGLTRGDSAEIGRLYGQKGFFELDHDELRVVRSSDAKVMRAVSRRR